MWLFFLVAWFVLLAAITFLAQQAFGYDLSHLPAWFAGLPVPQRLTTGAILTAGLALIGATAWRLSRQDRRLDKLRDRLRKTREDVVVAHALQNHLDATVQHLIESDPREAVSALHDKLGETEQRARLQQGRNESTDMHDQLAEIRRRQQALREMVGKVADQRRAVEPVFTEVRDRQNQLERSLHDLETDDRKNNLADRQRDIARDVSALLGRVNAVQETFATLNQYKEDLAKSHAELVPLRSTDAGINTLIGELSLSHDRLAKSIDELETGGEAPLDTRVETLSKNKIEIAQRLARIDDSFNILKAIRLDFEELGQRQAQLERSLHDLETDDRKNNLADRLKDIARDVSTLLARVTAVQDTFATLNRYQEDLAKSHAELVPLRSSDAGINALIGELGLSHDRLAKSIDELETGGEAPLGTRVEALSKNKIEIEQRLARIDDSANILKGIGLDFEELGQRRAQLERAIAEVETDGDGKSLTERQNALNDFVIQSRQRLGALQETLSTLNAFKTELSKSQADLVPLKAPVFGIEAMIAEVSTTRDLLAKTVGEIEANGEATLASRVDALTTSKREVEDRLARVFENFNALDALRKDIGGIFATIRNSLNRIG